MKKGNSNPMGYSSGITKPDAGVVKRVQAKLSGDLNKGNTKVPSAAKLNRPTADSTPSKSPMGIGTPPKTPRAKLNRKARTS